MGLLREMTVTSKADSVSLSLRGALWQSRALYIVAWGSNTKYSKMISPNVKVVIRPQHRARLYRNETRVSVGMVHLWSGELAGPPIAGSRERTT